jgi:hypothetical protein
LIVLHRWPEILRRKDLADELIEDSEDWQDVLFEQEAKKAIQLDADEETDDERNMFMEVYSSKNLKKSK